MTTPFFQAPLFPNTGLQNNQVIDATTAKALIAQVLPEYRMDENARKAIDLYVDQVQADEFVLSPRRAAEIAGAARTFITGDPAALARQQLVAEGRAADATKLPDHYRQCLAQTGATDEDIVEVATGMYPNLSRKEAVAKWTEVAAKTMAEPEPVNVITNPWTGSIKGQVFGDAG
jgi:hypothetical protein